MKRAHTYHRVFIYLAVLFFFLLYILDTTFQIFQKMNIIFLLTIFSCLIIPIFATKIRTNKTRIRVVVYSLILIFLMFYYIIGPVNPIWAISAWCTIEPTACFIDSENCEASCLDCMTCTGCYTGFCREYNGGCDDATGCTEVICGQNEGCGGSGCDPSYFCNPTNHCNSQTYYNGYKCNGGGTCNVHNGIIEPDTHTVACESCASDQTNTATYPLDMGINYWSGAVFQTGTTNDCCGDDAGEFSLIYRQCNSYNCGTTNSNSAYHACCNQAGACVGGSNDCENNGFINSRYRCYNFVRMYCDAGNLGVNYGDGCCTGSENLNGPLYAWSLSPSGEHTYNCVDGKDNDCDGDTDVADSDCCVSLDENGNSAGGTCVDGKEWNPTNEGTSCANNKWIINDPNDDGGGGQYDIDDVWMQDDGYTFYMLVSSPGVRGDSVFTIYFDVDEDGVWDCAGRNLPGLNQASLNAGATNCGNGRYSWAAGNAFEMAFNVALICHASEGCCSSGTNGCERTSGTVRVAVTSNGGDSAPNSGDSPNYAIYNFQCGGPEVPIPEFLFGTITALVILIFILGLARRQRIKIQE